MATPFRITRKYKLNTTSRKLDDILVEVKKLMEQTDRNVINAKIIASCPYNGEIINDYVCDLNNINGIFSEAQKLSLNYQVELVFSGTLKPKNKGESIKSEEFIIEKIELPDKIKAENIELTETDIVPESDGRNYRREKWIKDVQQMYHDILEKFDERVATYQNLGYHHDLQSVEKDIVSVCQDYTSCIKSLKNIDTIERSNYMLDHIYAHISYLLITHNLKPSCLSSQKSMQRVFERTPKEFKSEGDKQLRQQNTAVLFDQIENEFDRIYDDIHKIFTREKYKHIGSSYTYEQASNIKRIFKGKRYEHNKKIIESEVIGFDIKLYRQLFTILEQSIKDCKISEKDLELLKLDKLSELLFDNPKITEDKYRVNLKYLDSLLQEFDLIYGMLKATILENRRQTFSKARNTIELSDTFNGVNKHISHNINCMKSECRQIIDQIKNDLSKEGSPIFYDIYDYLVDRLQPVFYKIYDYLTKYTIKPETIIKSHRMLKWVLDQKSNYPMVYSKQNVSTIDTAMKENNDFSDLELVNLWQKEIDIIYDDIRKILSNNKAPFMCLRDIFMEKQKSGEFIENIRKNGFNTESFKPIFEKLLALMNRFSLDPKDIIKSKVMLDLITGKMRCELDPMEDIDLLDQKLDQTYDNIEKVVMRKKGYVNMSQFGYVQTVLAAKYKCREVIKNIRAQKTDVSLRVQMKQVFEDLYQLIIKCDTEPETVIEFPSLLKEIQEIRYKKHNPSNTFLFKIPDVYK